MPSEREKMLAGELYDPFDRELVAGRERARDLCQALNGTRESEADERRGILRECWGLPFRKVPAVSVWIAVFNPCYP